MPERTDDKSRSREERKDETAAAGPLVPPGETEPRVPEPSGPATKGVQPQTEDDIPEGGR